MIPLAAASLQAGPWQRFITGHVDLRLVHHEETGLIFRPFHPETNEELGLKNTTLVALPDAQTVQPSGALWAPIGAAAGQIVWLLPQTSNPDLLWLGTRGALDANLLRPLPPAPVFGSGQAGLQLIAMSGSGPDAGGEFALYTTDNFGAPTFRCSTVDGIDEADLIAPINASSHTHYNWSFTAPGDYYLTFECYGYLRDSGERISSQATLHFQVEPSDPILTAPLQASAETGAVVLHWQADATGGPVTLWQSHDLHQWTMREVIPATGSAQQATIPATDEPLFFTLQRPEGEGL
ncbi:MAG: choice-of-anchor M domain-containing protein [Verrucomicrobiota bacterium JB022]|nr:choice-of-anchor M domain-containing protein [Verrucomicrobiota bacterium JB022]